ncbi:MAG: tetratricopeptide repeat protein [Deltaproteobacteria bacterium]|nr:tetratricopeptide repeat protein [Deltaproteobacteria bacterium]
MSIDRAKVLESAQKFLAKGLLDKAIAEYRKLVEDDPKDPRTLLKIGDVYTRKGDIQGACAVYYQVADQYAGQGFFLKAVAVYKQILKLDPEQLQALEQLAGMYELLSLVSDAFVTYEQLLEVQEQLGLEDKIMPTLTKMVQIDPRNVPIHVKYAEALSREGKTEEAANAFEGAARVLEEQGNIEDYLKVAERLLYLRSDDVELARELAKLYLERGDPKRALVKLQTCFKANPKDIQTLEMIANGFLAVRQIPKTLSVYKEIARLHADSEQHEQQAEILRRVLELNPNDEEAKSGLAEIASKPHAPSSETPKSEKPQLIVPKEKSDPKEISKRTDDNDDLLFLDSETEENRSMNSSEEIPVTLSSFAPPASASVVKQMPDLGVEVPSAPSSESQINRLMNECDVFIRYSLHDKALSLIDKVLELDPHHVGARKILKDLYIDLGDPTEATNQLFLLAALVENSDRSAAADFLVEIIEIDPTNERARAELEALSIPENAAESDNTALAALGGDSFIPEENRAATKTAIEPLRLDTSERTVIKGAFSKPAEPSRAEALPAELRDVFEEIDFYLDQKLPQEACNTIRDALESYPNQPILLDKLRQIETNAAIPAKVEPEKEDRGDEKEEAQLADTHYESGIAYMETEMHDLAIREFEICLKDERLSCKAYTMLGLCHLAKGEIQEGISNFEAGLRSPNRTEEDEVVIHFELGNAYELIEDYERAQTNFQKVARRDPHYRDIRHRIKRTSEPPKHSDEIDEFDELFNEIILKD